MKRSINVSSLYDIYFLKFHEFSKFNTDDLNCIFPCVDSSWHSEVEESVGIKSTSLVWSLVHNELIVSDALSVFADKYLPLSAVSSVSTVFSAFFPSIFESRRGGSTFSEICFRIQNTPNPNFVGVGGCCVLRLQVQTTSPIQSMVKFSK